MFFFSRKFFPFFGTFFLGALNDNIFRYALSIMIVYQCGYTEQQSSELTFIATALLMLPQFPFSALAGEIADKFPQQRLFRWIKLIEVILMVLTFGAFLFKQVYVLLFLLFLMGTQSAFYSPMKYAYIPRNMPGELVRGNAYVGAWTYIAILGGMIVGIYLIRVESCGAILTGGVLILIALLGYFSARSVPELPAANPELQICCNPLKGAFEIIRMNFSDRIIRHCVIGLSIFWMAGALYVSQLSVFCKEVIGANEGLVIIFTLLFSLGVAMGALICSLIRKIANVMHFVSPALILMAVFTLDLYFASGAWKKLTDGELVGIMELIREKTFWRFVLDLVALAACGGFYSVPVSALMQQTAGRGSVARVVAGNNIVNAFLIVAGSLGMGRLTGSGLVSIKGVFVVIAIVNVFAALYLLPLRKQDLNTEKSANS